jgi:hypothetical protein
MPCRSVISRPYFSDQYKTSSNIAKSIIPHFKDDNNIKNDEARIRGGSNIHHDDIELMVDGKDTDV